MTVRVRLIGRPCVEADTGASRPQPRGHKSWAVLARVALSERPQWRGVLAEELFGATDDPLGSLRWSLADLRRGLGLPGVLRGDPLTITRAELWLDVWALEDGTLPPADTSGVLLDGVDLRECPAFDMWLMMARSQLAVRSQEEIRGQALRLLASGDTTAALGAAEIAAQVDPLDESAQELFLRALVADGREGLAQAHLAVCEGLFAREGLTVSPGLRSAAQGRRNRPPPGVRSAVVAASLLRAGRAALDAGAADGGVETLRRAAEDAERAADPALRADVLLALGGALVHSVRGFDGEGAVVLHGALLAAREARRPAVAADILRELAYVDVQAGRHVTAARSLREAADAAVEVADSGLNSAIAAIDGMNEADRGHHVAASALLTRSAEEAVSGGRPRQEAWSLGVLSRSLLLSGQIEQARVAAEASIAVTKQQRWNAFEPWPQAIRAECLAATGRLKEAQADAEQAFALSCELGDPCWEGMSARALGLVASMVGDDDAAWDWMLEARQRTDRVSDRYVWVSAYIGLAHLDLAARSNPSLVPALAARLHDDATRTDLPEFLAWALVHQVVPGDPRALSRAKTTAQDVDNPALHAKIRALTELETAKKG